MELMAKPRVAIEYCTACKFRGRAVWLAQELLSALEQELGEVALVPGRGGILAVSLNGEQVFSNKAAGRFPEPTELKELLRERLNLPARPRHG
jgi:selenoprotein W-related protein